VRIGGERSSWKEREEVDVSFPTFQKLSSFSLTLLGQGIVTVQFPALICFNSLQDNTVVTTTGSRPCSQITDAKLIFREDAIAKISTRTLHLLQPFPKTAFRKVVISYIFM
jgi:hypothetical protein